MNAQNTTNGTIKKKPGRHVQIYLSLFILLCCLSVTACSKKKEPDSKTTSETLSSSLENFEDDVISCSYNSSILQHAKMDEGDNILYGIYFTNDTTNYEENSENIRNGTCLYVTTYSMQAHSSEYEIDYSKKEILFAYANTLFCSLFGIEDSDSPEINDASSGLCEFHCTKNDMECYGKLFYVDDSKVTLCICRVLPEEAKEYKTALLDCYKSIEYIQPDNPNEEIESNNEITSGKLYNSIKNISSNVTSIAKLDETYSVIITCDQPKEFFKICKKIYVNAFKEKESVGFSLDTSTKTDVAMLMVIHDASNTSFPVHSSLTAFGKKYKKDIEKAYGHNKYWKSLDLQNQSSKRLQDIIDKYNLQ